MPFAVAAAGVGVAGAYLGAQAQSGAIKEGLGQVNQTAQQTDAQAQQAYQPFMSQGTTALASYANLTGINGQDAANTAMSQFQASPGYQYQLTQGLKGVDAGAAAKGMLRSGATLKAEQTLGDNLANQDFSNYMGRLNTLANYGLSGTNSYTNILNNQATNMESADAKAAGAQAGIAGNEYSGITKSVSGGIGDYAALNSGGGAIDSGGFT